jgi:hypothetical protein
MPDVLKTSKFEEKHEFMLMTFLGPPMTKRRESFHLRFVIGGLGKVININSRFSSN